MRRQLSTISALFGLKAVADVSLADAQALFQHVAARAPIQAKRHIAALSGLLKACERWGWRPVNSNPCSAVQRTRERARRRYLHADEAPRLAGALDAEARSHPVAAACIRVALLTGARRSELLYARRDQVADGVLSLSDSKSGHPRTIHLCDEALAILWRLPRNGDRLFCGLTADRLKASWERVRTAARVPDLRFHDLRHSWASVALAAGVPLGIVGEALGHRSSQTTKRYTHLLDDAARDAVALASARLSQMMKGEAQDADPSSS
jgi:integrase